MKTKIIIVLTILYIILCVFLLTRPNTKYIQQRTQLSEMKATLNNIEAEQKNIEIKINKIEEEIKASLGKASYYDYVLPSGWSSKNHRVCASRQYERGSMLKVVNLANGKSIECLVTDYGPDASIFPDRIVDMSSYSFSQISELKNGVINVQVLKIK